jgi:hypothetical protein
MDAQGLIRQLCIDNNISDTQDDISRMAVRITQMCGDDGTLDSVQRCLVNLVRNKVISVSEAMQLHGKYLEERRNDQQRIS